MKTTTIRVTMRNNSDARRADVLSAISSARGRHNGGKLVIVTVSESDVERACQILDADYLVAAYDVQDDAWA